MCLSPVIFRIWFFLDSSVSFSYPTQFTYRLKWNFCTLDRNLFPLPCWCETSSWRINDLFRQEHSFALSKSWCFFCIEINGFEPSFLCCWHWKKIKVNTEGCRFVLGITLNLGRVGSCVFAWVESWSWGWFSWVDKWYWQLTITLWKRLWSLGGRMQPTRCQICHINKEEKRQREGGWEGVAEEFKE